MHTKNHLPDLFISDLHLGGPHCDPQTILKILQIPYRKLFLVGDLIDGDNPIPDSQQAIVIHIRKNRKRIVILKGNHDPREKGFVRKILGIRIQTYERFTYKRNRRRIYVLHGDDCDDTKFLFNWPTLDRLFSLMIKYLKMVQIWGIGLNLLIHWPHKRHAWKVKKKVIEHAKEIQEKRKKRKKRNNIVICGHTHLPEHEVSEHEDGSRIEYFNCGGPDHRAFVTIDQNGNGKLHFANEYSLITTQ